MKEIDLTIETAEDGVCGDVKNPILSDRNSLKVRSFEEEFYGVRESIYNILMNMF